MAKKLLSILVFSFLFFSCSDEKEITPLDRFLEEIKIEPQLFYASTDSIIRVKGQKGTILTIDPNNIEFQNGEIPKEIRVELIELTTTEELLRNNVQTVSKGKWLISGGSFKISLFDREKPLSLKNGKTISAVFPKIRNENMQLFYGERGEQGEMNWEPKQEFFEEELYYGILNTLEVYTDTLRNEIYKVSGYYLIDTIVDSLGYSSMENHRQFFEDQNVEFISINQDTIKGYLAEVASDSTLFNLSDLVFTNVYKSIEINKLGWINIDAFYPEVEDRVTYEVTFDIPINHVKLFVVDKSNNTVVNIFSNNDKYLIDLPVEMEFTFIALGIKGEELYSSKKTVQVKDSKVLRMKVEIISESDKEYIFK